jgi:hypothetical protein
MDTSVASEFEGTLSRAGCTDPSGLDFDILIPIWGERYIRRFAELGLRTLLAPGNLPEMCRHHRVKLIVLTSREGPSLCRLWPAFAALGRIATIEFVEIDDLIAAYGGNYSVILTRAYNRAMALSGNLLGRNFIYLVGDQVFADGSLGEIARAMVAGYDACLACTARVEADAVAPRLAALGDHEALSLPRRDLVDLLLKFPHPTLAAKMVRDGKIHLNAAHQFFWQPTPDTLVARCFLLHMLCIRPTRRPSDIAAFCDFSFITELAPSGRYHYLDDSDAFLAIELQDAGHEAEFVTPYELSAAEVARSVSAWATPMHHACIDATFVFKGGNSRYLPAAAKQLSDPYVDELRRHLAPPMTHRHHPFWLGAIGAELLFATAEDDSAGKGLPAVLRQLVADHLGALAPEGLDLAVSAADQRSSLDGMLARHARTSIRISTDLLRDRIEDIAGPGGRLLAVLLGNVYNFLELFSRRDRIASLLRVVGPGRSILLCYRIEPEDFLSIGLTRLHLHRLLTARLSVFAQFGIPLRLHDLAPEPLETPGGFVVEITTGRAVSARATMPAWLSEAQDDPLFGLRADRRVAVVSRAKVRVRSDATVTDVVVEGPHTVRRVGG